MKQDVIWFPNHKYSKVKLNNAGWIIFSKLFNNNSRVKSNWEVVQKLLKWLKQYEDLLFGNKYQSDFDFLPFFTSIKNVSSDLRLNKLGMMTAI